VRVLLLEDDLRLATSYTRRLRADGHVVVATVTIAQARAALADEDYDCLVLDRRVPDGDALEFVAELDGLSRRPRVLILSALGEPEQRVRGLEAGVDDYMTKPVYLDELAIRVRKLLARAAPAPPATTLGRIRVDHARAEVSLDGEPVRLTRMQYTVFDYLVAHRDRMVPTQELLDHCWDSHQRIIANPLHSQITRLRKRFRGALEIESVRGVGYSIRVVTPHETSA
jgi:two-component system copper resistance phosphate regulon response regulator CusR